MNVIQPQSKPGTRCVFQVWAKTCPTDTNALDSWCEKVPWMCKVLHRPATSCEMDGNYLCSPIVQITAPSSCISLFGHAPDISDQSADWTLTHSGLFGIHLDFFLCESKPGNRKKLQVVGLGPEQTDYRCENALRLSEGVLLLQYIILNWSCDLDRPACLSWELSHFLFW